MVEQQAAQAARAANWYPATGRVRANKCYIQLQVSGAAS
jgi:hypothetical protein